MQGFIVGILLKVAADPKFQQMLQQMLKNLFGEVMRDDIAPLVPLAAASAAKALVDLIPGVNVAAHDVVSVANTVRDDLNKGLSTLGLPIIDDFLNAWLPH